LLRIALARTQRKRGREVGKRERELAGTFGLVFVKSAAGKKKRNEALISLPESSERPSLQGRERKGE